MKIKSSSRIYNYYKSDKKLLASFIVLIIATAIKFISDIVSLTNYWDNFFIFILDATVLYFVSIMFISIRTKKYHYAKGFLDALIIIDFLYLTYNIQNTMMNHMEIDSSRNVIIALIILYCVVFLSNIAFIFNHFFACNSRHSKEKSVTNFILFSYIWEMCLAAISVILFVYASNRGIGDAIKYLMAVIFDVSSVNMLICAETQLDYVKKT